MKIFGFIIIWAFITLILLRVSALIEGHPIFKPKWLFGGVLSALGVALILYHYDYDWLWIICLSIFYASEFTAACMDQYQMEVLDILHIIAFLSILPLMIMAKIDLLALIFYGIVMVILSFTFGLSDTFAFILTGAITLILIGQPSSQWNCYIASGNTCRCFYSMIAAYMIFFFIQLKNKNLTKYGNCKVPKPFIPSIYVADIVALLMPILI